MKCPKCGAQLAKGTKFCTSCGTKIEMVEETPMEPVSNDIFGVRCSKCGAFLSAETYFCPNCGTRTDGEYVDSFSNKRQKIGVQDLVDEGDEATVILPPNPEEKGLLDRKIVEKKDDKKKVDPKVIYIVSAVVVSLLLGVIGYNVFISPSRNYDKACTYLQEEKYDEAIKLFTDLSEKDYKDSADLLKEAKLQKAQERMTAKDYDKAMQLLKEIQGYSNSAGLLQECTYQRALSLKESGKYKEAISLFESVENYQDSLNQLDECKYLYVQENKNNVSYTNVQDEIYVYLNELKEKGYSGASTLFDEIFAWKVNIVASESETQTGLPQDTSTRFSRSDGHMYIYFDICQGVPGQSVSFKYDIKSGFSSVLTNENNYQEYSVGKGLCLDLDISDSDTGNYTVYAYVDGGEAGTFQFSITK